MGEAKHSKGAGSLSADFGAEGPVHVVAQEAELKRSTGSATFKGNVRLWQEGNSIAAPLVVLDRTEADADGANANAKTPVQVVLVSAMAAVPGQRPKPQAERAVGDSGSRRRSEVFRRRAEGCDARRGSGTGGRKHGGCEYHLDTRLELMLLPPGNHAGNGGAAGRWTG